MTKEDKIRNRVSYKKYDKLMKQLLLVKGMEHANIGQVLLTIHYHVDGLMGYRSESNSKYNKESIDLLIKDKNL